MFIHSINSDFKIRDPTTVRRGRKWIFKEVTYCACSRRRPDGITSRRERGFGNFDVLYKTWVYSFHCNARVRLASKSRTTTANSKCRSLLHTFLVSCPVAFLDLLLSPAAKLAHLSLNYILLNFVFIPSFSSVMFWTMFGHMTMKPSVLLMRQEAKEYPSFPLGNRLYIRLGNVSYAEWGKGRILGPRCMLRKTEQTLLPRRWRQHQAEVVW